MKKLLVVLSLLVFSCSTTSNYYTFDNALEIGTERIQNDLPAGAEVAILDFKSDNENLSAYVIEEMYDKLINFGKLSIMERSRTNTIAMEVGYQFSGEVDDSEIIAIGHQLGADYVVTGQIIYSGEAYRLRVFAIDIAKGRRVASSSLNINPNDRQINYLLTTDVKPTDVKINEIHMRNEADTFRYWLTANYGIIWKVDIDDAGLWFSEENTTEGISKQINGLWNNSISFYLSYLGDSTRNSLVNLLKQSGDSFRGYIIDNGDLQHFRLIGLEKTLEINFFIGDKTKSAIKIPEDWFATNESNKIIIRNNIKIWQESNGIERNIF